MKAGPFPLSLFEILWLLDQAKLHFMSQETLLKISSPIAILGDIHGQYDDLVLIMDAIGHPPTARYLLLGDYVDRGNHSLETILLLLSYMVLYPDDVWILRGNHELRHINFLYGFLQECTKKMSMEVYTKVNEVFEYMPLAATVDKLYFCCHGGIGPQLKNLE